MVNLAKSTATDSSPHVSRYMMLENGVVVLEDFYKHVKKKVGKRIAELENDGTYTAEILYGPEHWKHLRTDQKITAGQCISDMVKANALPLEVVPKRHEYPLLYRIK